MTHVAPRPADSDRWAYALDCDYCDAADVEVDDLAIWHSATHVTITFTCPDCGERNEQEH